MLHSEFAFIVSKDEIRKPGLDEGTVRALWISINARRIAEALGIDPDADIRTWKVKAKAAGGG